MARVGFLAPADPRFVSTVEAIQAGLTHEGFVHRYRAEESDDGLAGGEGTFSICTLWLVLALLEIERPDEAEEVFAGFIATGNDLDLFAEEVDPSAPAGRRQLGNYPQAFTHVAIVVAAHALARNRRMSGRARIVS